MARRWLCRADELLLLPVVTGDNKGTTGTEKARGARALKLEQQSLPRQSHTDSQTLVRVATCSRHRTKSGARVDTDTGSESESREPSWR